MYKASLRSDPSIGASWHLAIAIAGYPKYVAIIKAPGTVLFRAQFITKFAHFCRITEKKFNLYLFQL